MNPMAAQKPIVPPEKRKKLQEALKTVLKDVKPTEREMALGTVYANDLVKRLKKIVPKDVEIMSVGSVARGTQIRGTSDIDIFLLFPKQTTNEDMKKKGLEIGKKIVQKKKNESYEIKYAQHPYVRLILKDVGITADIVPAFKIKNSTEMISAVDRTPLHNLFVNRNLSDKQRDDVRLLKAFLNAHGIHGADAETEGFSGYLCELIVHQYGSFIDAIAHFSDAKLPILILPDKKEIHKNDSPELANAVKKFNKRFIVIDPTDPDRNVAAAVSEESLARFVVACRLLLRAPSTSVFYGPKYSDVYSEQKLTRIRKQLGLDIYLLHFKVPDISEDIIWQQLRRLEGRLKAALEQNGFDPVVGFESMKDTDAIIAFFMNTVTIGYSLAKGPSIYMRDASRKFTDTHTKSLAIMFDGDRLVSLEESKNKTPKDVILNTIKSMDGFPSSIKKEKNKLYINNIPEPLAKMLYAAFIKKSGI